MTDGHFKPRLTSMLRALGLDVTYERALGSFLYYRNDIGDEIEVLDMAGGYGSLLLGHSHPALVAEAVRTLAAGRPAHAQGSRRILAEQLARELSARAGGDYCAVFANSGTEAVEAALKHAMLETGGRTFVALEGAFHGQTLGALQLTTAAQYRGPFELAGLRIIRVKPNDIASLEAAFRDSGPLAGLVLEPIQGEGGIRLLTREFVQRAAALCSARNVPLVADECQTGMGRTGSFLVSTALGITPDYILLSKALGGGLAKIAVVLIARQRYVDEFDLMHTSTYADDDYSCAVALKTLELIDEAMLSACSAKGSRLLANLRGLMREFPEVIADVRGGGLMIGVEFRQTTDSSSFVLQRLSAEDALGFVLAGYLLAVHRLRVAPTLGSALTLRFEPSALTDETDLDRVVLALRDVCQRLHEHDAVGLTAPLAEKSEKRPTSPGRLPGRPSVAQPELLKKLRSSATPEHRPRPTRVAWLFHLIDADDLVTLDDQFARLSLERREAFLDRFSTLTPPTVMSVVDVRSATGRHVQVFPILLPVTSRWMKRAIDARRLSAARHLVQRGVDLAHALGCEVVSLGQYTSIVTHHATRVSDRGMSLTTGNSFSVALARRAIDAVHQARRSNPRNCTLAVVGAAGNIGRACAETLSARYRRVILLGSRRPGSHGRLERLARSIPNAEAATDSTALLDADVVVSAVNAVDAPYTTSHFAHEAIVCDLSVPASVTAVNTGARPDLCVIDAGIARLPFGEDLNISGFPLPPGHVYGCLAEGILLGLESIRGSAFTGPLSAARIEQIETMAARHGFDQVGGLSFEQSQIVAS